MKTELYHHGIVDKILKKKGSDRTFDFPNAMNIDEYENNPGSAYDDYVADKLLK